MFRILLTTPLVLMLLWGCSAAPRKELQAARVAVFQAEHAGARELAAEDFAQADAALRAGEALVRRGDFDAARQVLPRATSYAREALERAQAEQEVREQARLRAEKEAAARAAAPPPAPKQLPPSPSPSPPAPPKVVKPAIEPPAPPLTAYPVRESETLWSIAARKEVYGDPLLWPLLYQSNRDQIKDPRQVYPGQVLSVPRGLPAAEFEEAREKARRSGIFPPAPASREQIPPSPP